MESVLNGLSRRLRVSGWAVLFPVVMCVSFVCWGMRPWTWIAVVAALATAVLAPAVAADLLAVALIGFASYAFALVWRDGTLPPGSGTTTGYPLHSLVFGDGPPHAVGPCSPTSTPERSPSLEILLCKIESNLSVGRWGVYRCCRGAAELEEDGRELRR